MTDQLFYFKLRATSDDGDFDPQHSAASSDTTSNFSLDLSDDHPFYTTQPATAPIGYVEQFTADFQQQQAKFVKKHQDFTHRAVRHRVRKLSKLYKKYIDLVELHNGLITNEAKELVHHYKELYADHIKAYEIEIGQKDRLSDKAGTAKYLDSLPLIIDSVPFHQSDNDSFHPDEEDIDMSPCKIKVNKKKSNKSKKASSSKQSKEDIKVAPAELMLVQTVTPELVKIMGNYAEGHKDICNKLTLMM
ncbi:hypothetical protein HYPSUDRAFT_206456 [Hypholoma sublateritium FD-334 SS-4]|uniref:Uncharacterized protein n=1 Tax=Hypholoma sublateritium (strain FD-334 SS-4) TaxID=945553 RepID=A0A0D2P9P2_HYPSF|nr:hypothetical protein HYPSUDRAFT_206456 [Hypholoma sublateritium FD-334 SS-4]